MHEKSLWPLRPFGATMLLLGYDSCYGPKILEVDPLGNCFDCRYSCIGNCGIYHFLYPLIYFCSGAGAKDIAKQWDESKDPTKMELKHLLSECLQMFLKASAEKDSDFKACDDDNYCVDLYVVGESVPKICKVNLTDLFTSMKSNVFDEQWVCQCIEDSIALKSIKNA